MLNTQHVALLKQLGFNSLLISTFLKCKASLKKIVYEYSITLDI